MISLSKQVDRAFSIDHTGHVEETEGGIVVKTATVSKLKASLSEYLRRVKAGEEVLVIERGRPIAKLSPATGPQAFSQHLAEMEKQGLVKLGSGKLPKGFWELPRPKDPKGLTVTAVLEEREKGW
jgi:prevent-host-death family protein